jgi:serine/threonine-protein kinase
VEAALLRLVGKEVALGDSLWKVGPLIGSGGFGGVFEAEGSHPSAAIKFVPKQPGADRELLFAEITGAANVVPVIQTGSVEDFYVIVMPRADLSLEDYLRSQTGPLSFSEGLEILLQIGTALKELDGKIIHRDLKPANVLYLDGQWCLTDFGISRFTAAATAPHTRKYAWTAAYAAPEQWRFASTSPATDVYSFGVIAYQLFSGRLPFQGPYEEDFREQHLHEAAPSLEEVPRGVAALVDECLYKAAETRPTPGNLVARLSKLHDEPKSPAAAALAAVNSHEVQRRVEADRETSRKITALEKKAERQHAARASLDRISKKLLEHITDAAPSTVVESLPNRGWSMALSDARLRLAPLVEETVDWGEWGEPAFEVDSVTRLELTTPFLPRAYEGRSHSLWFGDLQQEGAFGWFEMSFMTLSGIHHRQHNPFALDPGHEASQAFSSALTSYQLAWPVTRLDSSDLDEFIERWALWFAKAASGDLSHPSTLPERNTGGTWRGM